MAFWERLKYAKEKAKMTNQDISERSGVPLPTVNRILSGGTDSPGVDNVRAIANALGVSLDEIFSEEKKPEEITNAGLLARMLSNKNETIRIVMQAYESEMEKIRKDRDEMLRRETRSKHLFMVLAIVSILAISTALIIDICLSNYGWFKR